MIVYLVISELGSWDSYRTISEKVFYTKENAENFVKEFEEEQKKIKSNPPCTEEEYFDLAEDDPLSHEYFEWDNGEYNDFNKCEIQEIELL